MTNLTQNDKKRLMELLTEDLEGIIMDILNEEQEQKVDNSKTTVIQKFCSTPGVTLVSPKLESGSKKRNLYFFDLISKEDKEYDLYYAVYNIENGKLSMVNLEDDDDKIKEDALKCIKASKIVIRDVYKDKEDIKSFFENMKCEVEDIFKTLETKFMKTAPKNECDAAIKENEKPNDENKEDEKKENNLEKQPTKKHAEAIHKIADSIISSKEENAFKNLCRLFAYIEKQSEKDGYTKTIEDILSKILKNK